MVYEETLCANLNELHLNCIYQCIFDWLFETISCETKFKYMYVMFFYDKKNATNYVHGIVWVLCYHGGS